MTIPLDIPTVLNFRRNLRACTACPLHERATAPVPWHGDPNPRYAVLGEAPGRQEDEANTPFVGPTGFHLRAWAKQAGLPVNDFTFLNTVSCYPAGPPSSEHVRACRGWMNGQLEIIRPKILITVGAVAFKAIRGGVDKPALLNLHGKPLFHPVYEFYIWPTYHPAAHMRGGKATVNGEKKPYGDVILDDLKRLAAWDGSALEECYICGDELYRYTEWGIGLCKRHSSFQGLLWEEDR